MTQRIRCTAVQPLPPMRRFSAGHWSGFTLVCLLTLGTPLTTLLAQEQEGNRWQLDVPKDAETSVSSEGQSVAAEALPDEAQAQTDGSTLQSTQDAVSDESSEVWQDTDAEEEQALALDDEFPPAKPEEPVLPLLDLEPQLRASLEDIFAQIIQLQETEDAYSPQLGEAYLTYSQALIRAGRLQEARDMLANALHITKINSGVNSIDQRPLLSSMFEIALRQDNLEASEELLDRILWIENKAMKRNDLDDFTYPLLLQLGNRYIDSYLYRPIKSATALYYLDRAELYLGHAVKRYGDRPIERLYMPYGELALVHLIKRKFEQEYESRMPAFNERRAGELLRFGMQDPPQIKPLRNSYGQAEKHLVAYLSKSLDENKPEHTVRAYLSLGDLNLLFNQRKTASQFYAKAWESAQVLPAGHPLLTKFSQPTALPDFFYAQPRGEVEGKLATVLVPLTFDLDQYGKVQAIAEDVSDVGSSKLLSRAKRAAKRLVFRPVIERGKMMPIEQMSYEVKVKVRREKIEKG